jgi:8-oxo-dGTP diphosphatase
MKSLNVRVYGILIHENKLLVSDEYIKGMKITKLPGGGLEFGEGTHDCLKREFKEELDLDVEIESHFYTTDFFVNSAFSRANQLISIYYIVKSKHDFKFNTSQIPFDFMKLEEGAQSMRWIAMSDLSENDFTFIIDKRVGELLINTIL